MTCNGCVSHVKEALQKIDGVENVDVDLATQEVLLQSAHPLTIEKLERSLAPYNGRYRISKTGSTPAPSNKKHKGTGSGVYYCPMQCEGKKTYTSQVDCPVCGMDLVEQETLDWSATVYICLDHPKTIQEQPGKCALCQNDLIPDVPANETDNSSFRLLKRKFWVALLFTLPIFFISMAEMSPIELSFLTPQQQLWMQCILSLPVIFYACWMFFERAYASVRRKSPNMFTLIGAGAGIAWLFSLLALLLPGYIPEEFKAPSGYPHVYFEASTVILTLALLGQLLEARAHHQTGDAIRELIKLAPKYTTRITPHGREIVDLGRVNVGDILLVRPGEKIPVDGIITKGTPYLDESMISGEPIPAGRVAGDDVHAGTLNGTTSFEMEARKIGSETLLSQIITLVTNASRSRAPLQNIADRISSYFVPVVMIISVLTFLIWSFWGPSSTYTFALINAIAVLIIACPCALGLATPMSVMVGIGKGAQSGVLIKDASAIEKLNEADVLLLDKTGTITEGHPSVERILYFDDHQSSTTVILSYLIALSHQSEHPLARAIAKHGQSRYKGDLPTVQDFESVTGRGICGNIEGQRVILGTEEMMTAYDIALKQEVTEAMKREQEKGCTVSLLTIDKMCVGLVALHDAIKPSTMPALKKLRAMGLEIIMLTGDHASAAKVVADQLGIPFQARMLPDNKQALVKQLQANGHIVAVAGDGINDAPALAQADVGIAMGTGTDVAIETADITLINGQLSGIVKAKILSSKTVQNIRQNLFFALVYNSLGIPIAAGILYPFFGILLSPIIAALAMSFSSVSVIANALRLRNFPLDESNISFA